MEDEIRLSLLNQIMFRLHLEPEKTVEIHRDIKIIQHGFTAHYESIYKKGYTDEIQLEPELSIDDSKFISTLLEVFNEIGATVHLMRELGEPLEYQLNNCGFIGWGEVESHYNDYAYFLVNDLKMFPHLANEGLFDECIYVNTDEIRPYYEHLVAKYHQICSEVKFIPGRQVIPRGLISELLSSS